MLIKYSMCFFTDMMFVSTWTTFQTILNFLTISEYEGYVSISQHCVNIVSNTLYLCMWCHVKVNVGLCQVGLCLHQTR